MTNPLIDIRDADFGYDDVVAVAGVNLTVAAGEALALIGSNGSGKSTILRSIAGLLEPMRGTILFSGRQRTGETAMLVGYLPQAETYDASFPVTLRQAVEMGRYRRVSWWRRMRQVDRVAVSAALAVTDLTDHAETVFANLSGGSKSAQFWPAHWQTSQRFCSLMNRSTDWISQTASPSRERLYGSRDLVRQSF